MGISLFMVEYLLDFLEIMTNYSSTIDGNQKQKKNVCL